MPPRSTARRSCSRTAWAISVPRAFWERPFPSALRAQTLCRGSFPGSRSGSGSVFLYGARPGVAQRAGEKLKSAYPGLRIAGAENGYISDETALFAALEQKKPDLLLLGLGAPRQELWMARNRQKINAVMIGVGGLLDVFAGDIPRAPESWQRLGLEWLYRLLREPKRLKRMIRLPKILLLAARERK